MNTTLIGFLVLVALVLAACLFVAYTSKKRGDRFLEAYERIMDKLPGSLIANVFKGFNKSKP
ncbi:MAG: hypothetical protein ACPGLV_04455 [Bacteroidia bacterium]